MDRDHAAGLPTASAAAEHSTPHWIHPPPAATATNASAARESWLPSPTWHGVVAYHHGGGAHEELVA